MAELTAQERQLIQKVDRLNWVIDRLQAALGVQVQIEAHNKNKPGTRVVFEITLAPGVWEDAEAYSVLRDAIYKSIQYKLEQLWKAGRNGWVEKMGVKQTKVSW